MDQTPPGNTLFAVRTGRPVADFPASEMALSDPNGLLALGGDLAPQRILHAYRRGIFPWYSAGQPLLWWSPDPRAVLFPGQVHISRTMARYLRQRRFTVTCDQAFEDVVAGCAAPRAGETGTWITDDMAHAYTTLHKQGFAHSIECWHDDQLSGGVYGIALGKVFFGESMFSTRRDASKTALITLAARLQAWDYALIDCQVENPHLLTLGATTIARREFESLLEHCTRQQPHECAWQDRDVTL